MNDMLAVLRQTPDAGPSTPSGRLMNALETRVALSDWPTIQLLLTVMVAAQRDKLRVVDVNFDIMLARKMKRR